MQNLLQLVSLTDLKMDLSKKDTGSSGDQNPAGPAIYTNFVANTYAYIKGAENAAAAK